MDLTDPNKQTPAIDNLYLDFNGIVYQCLTVTLPLLQ
jgi:5'-3' exonuclease